MSVYVRNIARVFAPLLEPARFKLVEGGRGSGKSRYCGEQLIEDCAANPGLRCLGVREVQSSIADSSKMLLADAIERMGLRSHFEVQEKLIKTPGGGQITFKGMQSHTADAAKSMEGLDRVWWDEAQRASASSLTKLVPTVRKDNAQLWFSWNPDDEDDPIEQFKRDLIDDGDEAAYRHVVANWNDNPWFPESLRLDMERDRRRDPDKYAHVWMGKYRRNSDARVFSNYQELEFTTPARATFYYGADWGFANDPTVLVRCFIEDRTLFVDHEAYKVGCKIVDTPALFETVPGARDWVITADSARPETIDYMKDQRFRIQSARKGPGSVEEGVNFLKDFDIVVHPRCKNTLDELAFYSYKIDKRTDQVLPVLEDKKNHVIDALRYAVEAVRREPGKVIVKRGRRF